MDASYIHQSVDHLLKCHESRYIVLTSDGFVCTGELLQRNVESRIDQCCTHEARIYMTHTDIPWCQLQLKTLAETFHCMLRCAVDTHVRGR